MIVLFFPLGDYVDRRTIYGSIVEASCTIDRQRELHAREGLNSGLRSPFAKAAFRRVFFFLYFVPARQRRVLS